MSAHERPPSDAVASDASAFPPVGDVVTDHDAVRAALELHRPYNDSRDLIQRCFTCATTQAYSSGAAIHFPWPCPTVVALRSAGGASSRNGSKAPDAPGASMESAGNQPRLEKSGPDFKVAVARLVAEYWRKAALTWGDDRTAAHPLRCVLAALDGETDPDHLGLGASSERDALVAWRHERQVWGGPQ